MFVMFISVIWQVEFYVAFCRQNFTGTESGSTLGPGARIMAKQKKKMAIDRVTEMIDIMK